MAVFTALWDVFDGPGELDFTPGVDDTAVDLLDLDDVEHWDVMTAGLPGRARIQYNHGLLLQQLGRQEEAQAALENAVAIEGQNLEFLYALANHHLLRGNLRSALLLAERMIVVAPDARVGHDLKRVIEQQQR